MTDSPTTVAPQRHIYDRFGRVDRVLLVCTILFSLFLIIGCTIVLFPAINDQVVVSIFGTTQASGDTPQAQALAKQFLMNKILFSVFCSGLLGSTFFGLRSLYTKLTRQVAFDNVELTDPFRIKLWLATFMYKPFLGGALAVVVLAMLNAGFLSLAKEINTSGDNTQSIYFQISFGFLVGFGANQVVKKIEEIVLITFNVPSKKSE